MENIIPSAIPVSRLDIKLRENPARNPQVIYVHFDLLFGLNKKAIPIDAIQVN